MKSGFGTYLWERTAIMQHRLVGFIDFKDIRYDSNSIFVDVLYPILKLFDPSILTLNYRISALYYGFSFNSFTVPVTPGPVGFGLLVGGVAGICAFGMLVPAAVALVMRLGEGRSSSSQALVSFMLIVLFTGVSTGNLFYWSANALLSAALFIIPARVFLKLGRRGKAPSGKSLAGAH
jgi:hypothetical protein